MHATQQTAQSSFFQKAPLFGSSYLIEKQYLTKVYGSLAAALTVSSIAAALDITYHIHGITTFLGTMLGIIMVAATPRQTQKFGWLLFTAFCLGTSLGPLISISLEQGASLVITAFLCTATMFACLSAAAILAPAKHYLFLGGMLSSAISMLILVGFLNVFFQSEAMHSASIYFGLLVYCGYVLFDTQVILEKRKMTGFDDHFAMDALNLLIDFIGMFVRILIILNKLNNKKK